MPIPAHTLESDFPEYADTIRSLRNEDLEFRSESESYNRLDKEIRGLEERGVATDDNHFNELKIRRAHMKDHLYRRILNGG
ncbi:YdcH family protein [uncultured Microbulbifer sp.]|uniref:YdcH family protein n=1 Tax=uncultured Microbulbifer sp. TaxID=348147 RepID=UPI0025E2BB2B|nr:YdcH family protein [uncultured Microbulbifer sp.]